VKYARNNQRREKARRASGRVTRDEYLAKAQMRREEAIRMRQDGMTQKQIAECLGINQSQVSRVLNKSIF